MKHFAIILTLGLIVGSILDGCSGSSALSPNAGERCESPSKKEGNVGNVINSATDDYAPKFIGNRLIYSTGIHIAGKHPKDLQSEFASSDHSGNFTQGRVNRGWAQGQLLGSSPFQGIPLDLNEGAFDVLPDKHYGVFAAERLTGGGGQSSLMDLYEVQLNDQFHATSTPEPIAGVNDPEAWDSQPTLSEDGNTLYFVSDRNISGSGPRGNQHIWRSTRNGGAWSRPMLLPKPFTSTGNDVSPNVGPDGYFYFSSDGSPDGLAVPEGMGRRDIYRVPIMNGELDGTPERLPAPFNSPQDDDFPFVTRDKQWMFLASDRDSGCGRRDIYAFPVPVSIHLAGIVTQTVETDEGFGPAQGIQTNLYIDDHTANKRYSIQTTQKGEYEVLLRPDHQYTVSVADFGCADQTGASSVDAVRPNGWDTTYVRNFALKRNTISIVLGKQSNVPFFITGYWRPNTAENLAAFKLRRVTDTAFAHIIYIDPTDYNYEQGSAEVDQIFEKQVYRPILDSILPLLGTACYDSNYILHLNVEGYTDKDCIHTDRYLDQNVADNEIPVNNGDMMDGPECGNKKLSILRAYFAKEMIKEHLMQDPKFAAYYNQGRIKITSHGRGIDHTVKSNQGFNRRVDVTAEVERR